jgi:hypothetical protein
MKASTTTKKKQKERKDLVQKNRWGTANPDSLSKAQAKQTWGKSKALLPKSRRKLALKSSNSSENPAEKQPQKLEILPTKQEKQNLREGDREAEIDRTGSGTHNPRERKTPGSVASPRLYYL